MIVGRIICFAIISLHRILCIALIAIHEGCTVVLRTHHESHDSTIVYYFVNYVTKTFDLPKY